MTDYRAYQKRDGDFIRVHYLRAELPDLEQAEFSLIQNGFVRVEGHQNPFVCRVPEETIAADPLLEQIIEAGPQRRRYVVGNKK